MFCPYTAIGTVSSVFKDPDFDTYVTFTWQNISSLVPKQGPFVCRAGSRTIWRPWSTWWERTSFVLIDITRYCLALMVCPIFADIHIWKLYTVYVTLCTKYVNNGFIIYLDTTLKASKKCVMLDNILKVAALWYAIVKPPCSHVRSQ